MVLDPCGILVPTPCANLPISFAFAMFHSFPLHPFKREGISSMWPVDGLTAVLAKGFGSGGGCIGRELCVVMFKHGSSVGVVGGDMWLVRRCVLCGWFW